MNAQALLTILRGATLYAPSPLGRRDIVMAGERIIGIAEPGAAVRGIDCYEIDASGLIATPGLIDNHVHVLGGGGGLGFSSRAPELQVTQLTRHGVTTVIGMLGFDATSKSMAQLVAKTRAFREDGISAYCLTGATLEHPVPTLTGRIRTDIAFVDEIIGVGEISISELGYGYDSFGAGAQYIAQAATEGLLAGRLARKAGYLCLQVPPYKSQVLKPMFDVVDRTGLPITHFIPSHVNQTPGYMEDAAKWGKKGGWVDIGANYSPDNHYERATRPMQAAYDLLDAGVAAHRILVSSDGNGAPPKEEKGENKPVRANYMPAGSLLKCMQSLLRDGRLSTEQALSMFTANVANATGLQRKGHLAVGADADIALFEPNWELRHLFARGRHAVADDKPLISGMFDETIRREFAL
jgi:beta-aspartyl-dipeptidase (metallo-type)